MGIDTSVLNFVFGIRGLIAVVLALLAGVVALGIVIGCYVLQSLGLYRLASRRGIKHPWLAWLPIGNIWILGSLSDQYSYVAQGLVRNRRKVLLWLSAGIFLLMSAFLGTCLGWSLGLLAKAADGVALDILSLASLGWMLVYGWVFFVLGLVSAIFQYICLYNLYSSCAPEYKLLCMVLSILFPMAAPILIFAFSKRDDGMPPRKDTFPE